MEVKLLIAIISAILALLSAIITIVGQFRLARFKANLDQKKNKDKTGTSRRGPFTLSRSSYTSCI